MTIQAVERALEILKAIDQTAGPARASALAAAVDLPRTTVIRMLTTLEKMGAVRRIDEAGGYQIGPVIQHMGQPDAALQNLKTAAKPALQKLARETNETIYLCTPAGDEVYYVDQIDSRHHILLRTWIGGYFPAYATAAGKVFLAHWPVKRLDRYLQNRLEKFTPQTVTDPSEIRAAAAETRRTGVAWTHAQTEIGLIGVAAPVYDPQQNVVAAVSLGGPSFRFPPPGQEKTIASAVRQTGVAITEIIAGM